MIELVGVSKIFGEGAAQVRALEGVDLRVASGEFVVVLGPSGSGKTTLLNLIGALDNATKGTISVAGADISQASRRQLFEFRRSTVSFIFQSFNIFPGLTAAESAWPVETTASPISCRAVNSNAWPLRGHSPPATRSCSPTSPPGSSISTPVYRSSSCCSNRLPKAKPCWWSPTIVRSLASPTGWSS